MRANGWRYPLVGGRGLNSLYGKMLRRRKLPENAATPTSQVHAVLGGVEKGCDFVFTFILAFVLEAKKEKEFGHIA